MEVSFMSVFPTPVGITSLGNMMRPLNNTLIADIETARHSEIDLSKEKTFAKNECAWQSKNGMEKDHENFDRLGQIITQLIRPVMVKAGMDEEYSRELFVSSMWANVIFAPGGYSQPHIHGSGRTLWTGVYYPNGVEDLDDLEPFNEDDYIHYGTEKGSGNLILMDPSWALKSMVKYPSNSNSYSGPLVQITPRESMLLMFPVWLPHMVQPVVDHRKRYSISFSISKPE